MSVTRLHVWVTALSVVAIVTSGCVKKTLSTTNNFVTKDGETVIFSLSQNELEMGRFRLCMTPYGLFFGQEDTDQRQIRTKQYEECRRINKEIALASQPKFETVTVDAADAQPTEGKIDDFSTIKEAPKPGEAAEVQGSASAPQAPNSAEDVKVTLQTRDIREEVHSFFTGSHLTPRCWYRFDRPSESSKSNSTGKGISSPDFLTTNGRMRTLLTSKRLTRYSISSANIVKSILADDKLRSMKFNVRSEEVLQAMEYNKNLQTVQGNQFYTWLIGFAGAGALKLSADQLANVSALARSGSSTAFYEIGKVFTQAAANATNERTGKDWATNTLKGMIQKKGGFIANLTEELEQLKEANKAGFGDFTPGKGIPTDVSNDIKHKMWQANYLQSTIDRETKFLEKLTKRAASIEDFDRIKLPPNFPKTAAFDSISHFVGTSLSRLYRHCDSLIGMGICIGIAGATLTAATQFAVDKYTVLGFKAPTAEDMSVEDLEMAANMFSSSKFNIELSREEIELLAATNDTYSERPKSFLSAMTGGTSPSSGNKNLGFIPIIGDSPGSGVVCPTPFVAAQIVGLQEPSGTKFQLLRDAMKKAGMSYLESGKTE